MSQYLSILEQATEIAERAAKLALSHFRQPILIEMKDNGTPVTVADKKTEQFIRAELTDAFPTHGILGEEFGAEAKDPNFLWTVDPIDGTKSFIRGIPTFGTLLALIENDEPVIGIMILPALGESYVAGKGLGAFCNGTQVHVAATKSLGSALVSVGDVNCFEAAGKRKYLNALLDKSQLCRGYTDCFGHSLVIRGAIDAMVDPVVNAWDVAPLACLVREAGGDYCDFTGARTFNASSFISFTPELRHDLVSLAGLEG